MLISKMWEPALAKELNREPLTLISKIQPYCLFRPSPNSVGSGPRNLINFLQNGILKPNALCRILFRTAFTCIFYTGFSNRLLTCKNWTGAFICIYPCALLSLRPISRVPNSTKPTQHFRKGSSSRRFEKWSTRRGRAHGGARRAIP